MTNLSHLVREYIEQKPFLQEALAQGIINYAALGEQIKEFLEEKLGTELKHISVIMAIRRYQEKLLPHHIKKTKYGEHAEANLKTNLHMFTMIKSNLILSKLNEIIKHIPTSLANRLVAWDDILKKGVANKNEQCGSVF